MALDECVVASKELWFPGRETRAGWEKIQFHMETDQANGTGEPVLIAFDQMATISSRLWGFGDVFGGSWSFGASPSS